MAVTQNFSSRVNFHEVWRKTRVARKVSQAGAALTAEKLVAPVVPSLFVPSLTHFSLVVVFVLAHSTWPAVGSDSWI